MRISKELLERYELGQCTDREELAIRQWIETEDWELENVEDTRDADRIKGDLWGDISAHIDHTDEETTIPLNKKRDYPNLKTVLSVAASAIIILGIGWASYRYLTDNTLPPFEANNRDKGLISLTERFFDVTLSENSSANINFRSGNIAVSGDILFKPKRDFVLYDKKHNTSFDFKGGEVYYMSTDPDTSRLIVFPKSEMHFLPPLIQKYIRKQFHLT